MIFTTQLQLDFAPEFHAWNFRGAKPKKQKHMKAKPLSIAIVLIAFTVLIPALEAAPPYKVPGIGYFDGNLNKNKKCDRTYCVKSRSCKKAAKCSKSNRSVKVVTPNSDSKVNQRQPYWKRKTH